MVCRCTAVTTSSSSPLACSSGSRALAHRDRDGREFLTDVVVQVTGHARAFRLLRRDETSREVLDLRVALPQRRLIGTQRLFRLTALGDVETRPDVAEERAVGGEPGHAGIEHPSVFAIRPLQAVLHPEGLSAGPCGGVGCQTALQVVRVHAFRPAVADLVLQAASPELQPRLVEEVAALGRGPRATPSRAPCQPSPGSVPRSPATSARHAAGFSAGSAAPRSEVSGVTTSRGR